jgi:hypothetical protein
MPPGWIFMNKLFQLVLLLCVAAALALWWRPDLLQQAEMQARRTGLLSNTVTLYRWRDEEGVWQYAQYPPTGGVPYEEIETRTDINVLRQSDKSETDE